MRPALHAARGRRATTHAGETEAGRQNEVGMVRWGPRSGPVLEHSSQPEIVQTLQILDRATGETDM
jgi:hypothetical protein